MDLHPCCSLAKGGLREHEDGFRRSSIVATGFKRINNTQRVSLHMRHRGQASPLMMFLRVPPHLNRMNTRVHYQLRLIRGSSCGAFSFNVARRCSSSEGARNSPSAPTIQMSFITLPCLRLPGWQREGHTLTAALVGLSRSGAWGGG